MIDEDAYNYAEIMLVDYRTNCCNVQYYRKGRAELRCTKCDKDVTMELVMFSEMFIDEYKLKRKSP